MAIHFVKVMLEVGTIYIPETWSKLHLDTAMVERYPPEQSSMTPQNSFGTHLLTVKHQ